MRSLRRPRWCRALGLALAGCASTPPSATSSANAMDLTVTPDPPLGGEALTCFGFDATPLHDRTVASIAWHVPTGAVALHHAALYAVEIDVPAGPTDCVDLPAGGAALHLWSPGNDGLSLDADTGLAIPPTARRLLLQTHAIRLAAGEPQPVTVHLALRTSPPAHTAAFFGANAAVPSLPPHESGSGGATCRVQVPAHVLFAWPHMHRAGTEFHASVLHADGTRDALVDVAPWSVDRQLLYPPHVDLTPGDEVETHCAWFNATDATIREGPLSQNEMCSFGLVLWPAEAAYWGVTCE